MVESNKQHAACDECRRRKIKCSGEPNGCVRCRREGLQCVYSSQKPMGRPKKRLREDEAHVDLELDFTGAYDENGRDQGVHSYDLSSVPDFVIPNNDSPAWLGDASMDDALSSVLPPMPSHSTSFPPSHDDIGHLTPQSNPPLPDVCNCLANMFNATSMIPADDQYFFPQSLGSLRFSLAKADEILQCAKCNIGSETGAKRQNVNFILTLLSSLGCAFDKLLREVDAEARRVAESGMKKPFAMGDTSPHLAHLHSGDLNCPMRFDVELDADEWRKLAFRAIKAHVNDAGNGRLTLEGLVNALESRQRGFHARREAPINSPVDGDASKQITPSCVQLARNVRLMIDEMPS